MTRNHPLAFRPLSPRDLYIAALLVAVLTVGCTKPPAPPLTVEDLHKRFVKHYNHLQAKGESVETRYAYGRPLFQQAMPRPDGTRAIWYLRGETDPAGVPPTIETPEKGETEPFTVKAVSLDYPSAQASDLWLMELVPAEKRIAHYTDRDDWKVIVRTKSGFEKPLTVRRGPQGLPFSFLALSCNRPYHGEDDPEGFRASNINALNLLRVLATQGDKYRPDFALGLGDQLYLDPDPDADHDKRFSLFHGKDSDFPSFTDNAQPLIAEAYRAHFAIPPWDEALASIPSAMIWDDHEIRDGYGSRPEQDRKEKLFFEEAKNAFRAYQAARNPPQEPRLSDPDLDFKFAWGSKVRFFVIDSRSSRNTDKHQFISPEQEKRLFEWLDDKNLANKEMLFVVGSPATLMAQTTKLAATSFGASILGAATQLDDINDSWSSQYNRDTRQRVLERFRDHFRDNPKHRLLVLSGDVHESGLLWLTTKEADNQWRVFGHEIISSGITNTRRNSAGILTIASLGAPLDSDVEGLQVWAGGGVFHAPAFVQVFVDPQASPLDVRATFYPSGTSLAPRSLWPYDRSYMTNSATKFEQMLARDQQPWWFPGWTALRSGNLASFGNVLRVPLSVGPLPTETRDLAGNWPEVYEGALPFDPSKKWASNGLHGLSVWCQTRVKQNAYATDWFDVANGAGDCEDSRK